MYKRQQFNNGTNSNLRYIEAFAALAASEIEQSAGENTQTRVRIVKVPSEMNIILDPIAQRNITGNNKKIDIRGPVFTTVRSEFL